MDEWVLTNIFDLSVLDLAFPKQATLSIHLLSNLVSE